MVFWHNKILKFLYLLRSEIDSFSFFHFLHWTVEQEAYQTHKVSTMVSIYFGFPNIQLVAIIYLCLYLTNAKILVCNDSHFFWSWQFKSSHKQFMLLFASYKWIHVSFIHAVWMCICFMYKNSTELGSVNLLILLTLGAKLRELPIRQITYSFEKLKFWWRNISGTLGHACWKFWTVITMLCLGCLSSQTNIACC